MAAYQEEGKSMFIDFDILDPTNTINIFSHVIKDIQVGFLFLIKILIFKRIIIEKQFYIRYLQLLYALFILLL